MKRDLECFHYHQKFKYITDNSGDNKLGLVEKVKTRCMLPTASSVINTISMIKIWNFIPSNGERLGMFSLSPEMSVFY